MADISRDEFGAWMELIRSDIKGVHTRLDTLNGRTRAVETELAVMKASGSDGGPSKDSAARWGAGIGAGLLALWQYFGK